MQIWWGMLWWFLVLQIKFAVSYLYAWMFGKMNGEVWGEMYILGITEYPGYFDIYPEDVLIKNPLTYAAFVAVWLADYFLC